MRITRTGWLGLGIVALVASHLSWAAPRAAALETMDGPPAANGKGGVWGAARFQHLVDLLRNSFRKGNPQTIADSRDSLYLFEGLLRLYSAVGIGDTEDSHRDLAGLRVLHDQVKQLEDEVGGVLEVTSLLSHGHGDAGALRDEEQVMERRLRQVLADGGWIGGKSTRFDQIAAALKHTDFGTPENDRNLVLARVAAQLTYASERVYDMHDVEGGIHELRRQSRWYRYYTAGLSTDGTMQNSLLRTTVDHCPLDGAGPDLGHMSGPGPCVVSRCLVGALAADEETLDKLKRVGANDAADGRGPGPEMVQGAENVWRDLQNRHIMSSLATQVRACMTTKR